MFKVNDIQSYIKTLFSEKFVKLRSVRLVWGLFNKFIVKPSEEPAEDIAANKMLDSNNNHPDKGISEERMKRTNCG